MAALVYATYQPANTIDDGAGANNAGTIVYNTQAHDLLPPDGQRDYLEAKGLRENPLKDDATEANRLWNQGGHIALSVTEQALFGAGQRATLDTNGAKHAAAVLLAHLRAAKGNVTLDGGGAGTTRTHT